MGIGMLCPNLGKSVVGRSLSDRARIVRSPGGGPIGAMAQRQPSLLDTDHQENGVHGPVYSLERFRAKWIPVRVKKTRQNNELEPRL